MGLDSVELVLEFEDEFGITIPDEDAELLLTIGDVVAYVTAVQGGVAPDLDAPRAERTCDTSRSFYALRQLLTTRFGLRRRAVVPRASLGDLVPRRLRQDVWKAAREDGIRMPELRLPLPGLLLLTPVVVAGAAAGLAVAIHVHPLLLFVAITAVGAAGLWMLDPLRGVLPAGCDTVGELARRAWVPMNVTDAVARTGPRDPDVLHRVRVIVSDQMGVPIETLTPQTRFVEDLHVD